MPTFNTDGIEENTRLLKENSDTLESLIASTNSLITAGNAQITEVNTKISDARTDFIAGRVRRAGGKMALTTSQTGVFQIMNPVGSGKVFTIWGFTLASDATVDFQFSFDATLGGTPVDHVPYSPNRAVTSSTSALVKSTTGGATGGTILSPIHRIVANQETVRDFNVVLTPGQSMDARITMGAVSMAAFYVTCSWSEDPA